MPLLKKKEFHKSTTADGFRDNEEIFYCCMTNEIFRDYDEFCTRVILCNSMVWTCKYTGKSGLTFSEALESESHAKKLFKDFPSDLRVPVLFITSKTQRSSFHEMLEDVYGYVKDRYFVGENVEASFSGNKWHVAHILQVISPTPEKLKKSPKNGLSHYGPPATLYHYEVEQMDSEDPDLSEVMIVSFDRIRRKKKLGRDKLKLFLKQYVEQNELGVFIVKQSVLEKFGIHKVRFDQIFDGSTPNFEVSKKIVKRSTQPTLVPFLKNNGDNRSKSKSTANGLSENSNNLMEKMRKRQEDFLKKKEDLKLKRAEDRIKQREENLKISHMLKDWYRPKEDLELEDHKLLPELPAVRTQIPEEYMGDVFTILEFVKTFSKFLTINNFFPGGLTFETMERALIQKEVAGPLMDLIQMLLSALFSAQIEETSQYNTKLDNSDIKGREYNDNINLTEATYFATQASNWSTTYQGIPLTQLPLYTLTTSEILRLHLLSSGARLSDTGTRWRSAYRGGYSSEDDPGLYLRVKHPHILKALSLHCITELPTGDILKVIDCLMSQLLSYADLRDLVEDQLEKVRQAKVDYKATQIIERRQEQEYATAKFKIKKECKESIIADPTEQLDKLTREYENKKAEAEKKLGNLMKVSNQHQIYLGQDRAYRKYLKLNSIPGIVINFQEDNPGYCYKECIQQNPDLINAGRSEIITHLHKVQDETNTSDKENAVSCSTTNTNDVLNIEATSNKPTSDPDKLLICNSNPETCMVHSASVSREKWSFLSSNDQVMELVNCLNARGIHESELKQTLNSDEKYFSDLVEKTPLCLNPALEVISEENNEDEDNAEKKPRNSKSKSKPKYENATLGYPKECSTAHILQYVLVENILEIEEKIFAGNLGSIKVKDRETWRTSLANHQYDLFDKSFKKDTKINKIKENGKNSRSNTPDITKEYHDPGKYLGTSVEVQSSDTSINLCNESLLPDEHNVAVRSLAYALVQVADGIDSRYLKKPLGSASTRSDTGKICDILDKWKNSLLASTSYGQIFVHYSSLDNCVLWTRSALLARCMVCRKQRDSENMLLCDNCNKGQHLYCHRPKLKSVPKGDWFCNVCRKQKEAEEKLKNPTPQKRRRIFMEEEETSQQSDDDADEQPLKMLVTKTRKKRKMSIDSGESSEQSDVITSKTRNAGPSRKKPVPIIEEEENSDTDSHSQNDAEEENDENVSEQSDVNEEEESVSAETSEAEQNETESDGMEESDGEGTGAEKSDDEEETMDEEDDKDTDETEHTGSSNVPNGDLPNGELSNEGIGDPSVVEVCEKCGIEGTLLCCDNCPELYHLECASPPLRRVPRGEWFCHKCRSSKKKEDTDDDWYLSHSVAQRSGPLHNQRRCAARARNKTDGLTKILRRISKYEDHSRRSGRRDDLPLNNAQLQEALAEVMKQDFAWPFLRPVNKNEVPDYYEIVENPMDFGTVKYKLNMGRYRFDAELMADVILMFENCKLYNNPEDEVYQCGLKLLSCFVDKCHELGLLVPHALVSREALIDSNASNTKSETEKMEEN